MASKPSSKAPPNTQGDLFGSLFSDEDPFAAPKKASVPVEPAPKAFGESAIPEPTKAPPLRAHEVVPELPKILSVSEIDQLIRENLRERFPEILVQGEICDFKGIHRSGHLYFGLKDEKSQIRAVMWKGELQKVPFDIRGGLEVIVTGKIDFYPGSGSLQIVASRMEPVGIGALQLKFEQLKEKLRLEGLFDPSRKRKVASLNWRIGVVTGRSTAALQDILRIFKSRFPLAEIFFFHAAVQGEKAPGEVISAIKLANRFSASREKPLDVLIVGRGGGSYEDLFCFNDEGLARAIVASKVPVVSAVGHEIDVTIADMVADRRSATPSHAAQETVPELQTWLDRLEELESRFRTHVEDLIFDLRQKIDHLQTRLQNAAPQKRLEFHRQALSDREIRLKNAIEKALERRRQSLARFSSVLDALSPLKVLERGYAMTEGPKGILRSVKDVTPGDTLRVRLADGSVTAQVTEKTSELG